MQEVDPLALLLGTRVGPWRVTGFRGRGSYGTLYRAERVGREEEGAAALKPAVLPGDERFKREGWLLRHIHSLYVPGFKDEGEWEHPTGVYPYVVMELVEGEPRWRSPKRVRLAKEQDAAARQEAAQRVVEENPRAVTSKEQGRRRIRNPLWGEEMAVALVGLLFAMLTVAALYQGKRAAGAALSSATGDVVAVGDSASTEPISALAPMHTDGTPPAVGLPMPEKPFDGQRTPPCTRHGEVEIRGGCWYRLGDAPPPCKEDAYDWNGACYLPSYPARRQPTTQPP